MSAYPPPYMAATSTSVLMRPNASHSLAIMGLDTARTSCCTIMIVPMLLSA